MSDRSYRDELWAKIYPCDGFNPVAKVGDPLLIEYIDHPITQWTSLFGIPNRPLSKDKKQSAGNILKNLPLLLLPWNFIGFIPGVILRLLKLITEYLPFLAAHKLEKYSYNYKKPILLRVLASWVSNLFNVVGLLGRCVTSPVTSMRAALAYGEEIHANYPVKAAVTGGLLLALSLAITVTVYALLFPFIVYPLAAPIAAFASAYLPPAFMNAFAVIQPFFETIGFAIEAAFGLSLLPVATGIASTVGLLAATVGAGISRLITKTTNWFYHGHFSVEDEASAKLREDINYDDYSDVKRPASNIVIRENYLDGDQPKPSTYARLMSNELSGSDTETNESAGVLFDSESHTSTNESIGVNSSVESVSEVASQSAPHPKW